MHFNIKMLTLYFWIKLLYKLRKKLEICSKILRASGQFWKFINRSFLKRTNLGEYIVWCSPFLLVLHRVHRGTVRRFYEIFHKHRGSLCTQRKNQVAIYSIQPGEDLWVSEISTDMCKVLMKNAITKSGTRQICVLLLYHFNLFTEFIFRVLMS